MTRSVLIAVGADVLPDEPRPVDLDEVPLLQQADRAVHLREQPRDRRLAGARVAEEHEVLGGRDLRQPVRLAARLHLEERDERADLLLHRLEPDQGVELGLQLRERPRRARPAAEQVVTRSPTPSRPGWRSRSPTRPMVSRRSSSGLRLDGMRGD